MNRKNIPAALCLAGVLGLSVLCGPGAASPSFALETAASAIAETQSFEIGGWQICLEEANRTASLDTVSVALGYTGVETKNLEKSAAEGREFCLLKLSFVKEDSTESIEWQNLQLMDGEGSIYSRIDDDFLTDYGMKRLPGTALNFGSYEGWICFEIPREAEDLKLVYPFTEERLVIRIEAEKTPDSETLFPSSETDSGAEDSDETADADGTEALPSSGQAWHRLESTDYFSDQRAIDYNLWLESQKGYSFEDPLIVINPYQNSPLSAMVIFTTPDETPVDAIVKGKDGKNDITATFPSTDTHILPIYGLYAGDTTQVELMLDTGEYVELEITTEKLDTSLDQAELTVCREETIEDGLLTFVSIQSTREHGSYGAVAYDNAGEIRWIMEIPEGSALPLKRLKNGRMMMSSSRVLNGSYYMTGLVEFDLCGKYYRDYLIPGGEHHDFYEMENGNLLVASCTEDFSTVEDRIVEVDRETGDIVWELNLADLIDPSDGGSLNRSDRDWCHNNSIDYEEETDTLMLSCRNLDAVLGIDRTKKELKWVLGDPTGFSGIPAEKFFTPVNIENGFEWQYAQHNATFLPDGSILLFDNGSYRAKAGNEDQAVSGDGVYSRAVRYRIDPEAMTIEQLWSYGKERGPQWYSGYISGVSYLSEKNYWITSGSNSYDAENNTYDVTPAKSLSCDYHTWLNQVKDGELVYELVLPALSYRSIRIPMYPGEDTYSIYERGTWLGSLGAVAEAGETATDNASEAAAGTASESVQADYRADLNPSGAQEIDFTLSSLVQMPDRIVVSGSWPETGDDAALVLIDEKNTVYRFRISPPAYRTSADSMNFSVWITPESIPYSHRYRIYLYNQGILYTTWAFLDNYVDTSDGLDGRGPQKTLYDTDGRSYTLMTSEEIRVSADLDTEASLPVQTQAISDEILSELEKHSYTFENPLVIQNPYQNTPLTTLIAFETEEACQVRITVKGKTESGNRTDTLGAASLHLVPVLGLYADSENEILLELLDASGSQTASRTLTIRTDKLPQYLRSAVQADEGSDGGAADHSSSVASAMDLILISGLDSPYLYAFDAAGDIRWYCTLEREYYGAFPLENGHILMESPGVLYPNASMPNSPEFLEMDYLGRVYQIYYFPEGVHHEIKEMTPGGNFLIATNSNDCYEQNLIQEIDRETGTVVKSLCLNDLFEGLTYIDRDDWCHINTLSYDPETDSVLVSSRNLHSVIRINWTTDEILWILSDPQVWESTPWADKLLHPDSDFPWHYQQHTAYEVGEDLDGNPETVEIMLFDNHNAQYRMLDDFRYTGSSYVIIYSVNAADRTVSQLRNYETAFSSITSNAFYCSEEKRVFSVNAYLSADPDCKGRIYELDYETGEQLHTWFLSHKFYRGYPVSLSMKDCASPFTLPENYRKGTLRAPVEVENPVRISGSGVLTEETIHFILQENVLYVQGGDHMYTQILFNGLNHTYAYDISDIKLISENANSYQYRLPIPLSTLEPDTYSIQVMYMNRLYNTPASFTISSAPR
ncbi:MAG: aryl-sulfate sulfotransferase [Candidatus Limivivens sp.]|nr:aryl-sulfate sulfotransferase [Candidatus Limivivens sp.]